MMISKIRGMTDGQARVSVTVDRVLLRRCDRVARGASRSQVFEQALERWLRDLRQRSLEEEIERHYSSLSGTSRSRRLRVGRPVVREPSVGLVVSPAPLRGCLYCRA